MGAPVSSTNTFPPDQAGRAPWDNMTASVNVEAQHFVHQTGQLHTMGRHSPREFASSPRYQRGTDIQPGGTNPVGNLSQQARLGGGLGWGPGSQVPGASYVNWESLVDAGGEDPWGKILAESEGGVCYVPAGVLEHLRRIGEAQLAEISELRRLVAEEPAAAREAMAIESRLGDAEASRLVAANEVELRKQEVAALGDEIARLTAQRDNLREQMAEVQNRSSQLERWLDPYRQTTSSASGPYKLNPPVGVSPIDKDFEFALREAVIF